MSDSLPSVTANNTTAKTIKADLTTAIGHADKAYELAKQLRINWEETLLAEAKKKAAADAVIQAAADAATAAAEKASRKVLPSKCGKYTYSSATVAANPTAESCSGTKCADYRGKQTLTISGKTCQLWTSQKPHQH